MKKSKYITREKRVQLVKAMRCSLDINNESFSLTGRRKHKSMKTFHSRYC